MSQGPNIKRLFATAMAREAIPPGGGFADGVRFLTTPGAMVEGARKAQAFVTDAIAAVRSAADPNPLRDATDEDIAGEILRQVEERKAKR